MTFNSIQVHKDAFCHEENRAFTKFCNLIHPVIVEYRCADEMVSISLGVKEFFKFDHLRQIKVKTGHAAVVHAVKTRIHTAADIDQDAIRIFLKNEMAYSSYFFARRVICTTSSSC